MTEITLQHGDPRLGIFDADGGVVVWPTVDLFGADYSPLRATFHYLPGGYFVVTRAGADHGAIMVSVAGEGETNPATVTDPSFVQNLVQEESEPPRRKR